MKLRCKLCQTYYHKRIFHELDYEKGHCFSCNTINQMIKAMAASLQFGSLGKASAKYFKEKLDSITY